MSKIIITITLIIIFLFSTTVFASVEKVTSNDLIDKANEYDGHEIAYTGEVIGDIMVRGDYAWINVSDGNNAIGIWIKNSSIKDINMVGSYNNLGVTIEVIGVFNRACADHGGDFDIHGEKLEVIQKGYAIQRTLDPIKVILAYLLFAIVLICIGIVIKRLFIKTY